MLLPRRASEHPRGLAYVRDWFGRYWLAVWFGVISAIRLSVLVTGPPAHDGALYLEATRRWLSGIDVWATPYGEQWFAAPPASLLPLVPLAILPPDIGVALLLGLCTVAAIATVRLLRLPLWWLLFPPLVDGLWTANTQLFLVPLLLARGGWLAAILKVYALVPLLILGRWRQVGVSLALLVVTIPLLPWIPFFEQLPEIGQRLAFQSDGGLSATAAPILLPIAIVGLLLVGRRRAAWLAVPAVWPSTQWYYSTLAMPGASHLAAACLAVPLVGAPVAAVVACALTIRLDPQPSAQRLYAQ